MESTTGILTASSTEPYIGDSVWRELGFYDSSSINLAEINNESFPNSSFSEEKGIPKNFVEMSDLARHSVAAYAILFLLGAVGNVSVFFSVLHQVRRHKSRIALLILHLSVADMCVIFFVVPMEIIWRITIQWYGGNYVCKFCQFFRAFGLYLSSMVVICISLDRYYAIMHPLNFARCTGRIKVTLSLAWGFAALFALPQIVVFRVVSHPKYPAFKQCVTGSFLLSTVSPSEEELIYNVCSVTILYFIPLSVIVYTYSRILWKIFRKSRNTRRGQIRVVYKSQSGRGSLEVQKTSSFLELPEDNSRQFSNSSSAEDITNNGSHHHCSRTNLHPIKVQLRANVSAGGSVILTRAKNKTLRLSCILILAFIGCWTGYVLMILWYMIDRESAKRVNPHLQESLFIMAVANSVVNPLIYGTLGRRGCTSHLPFSGYVFTRKTLRDSNVHRLHDKGHKLPVPTMNSTLSTMSRSIAHKESKV